MARPRRKAGEPDTREQILEAARLEFAVHGLAARLEDIAARCDIRRASLLHHFSSKQAMMDALFDRSIALTHQRIRQAFAETRDRYPDAIRGVTAALRQMEHDEQGTAAILLHALMADDSHEALKEQLQQLLELVTSLALQAGAGQHQPPETIRAVIAHLVMGEFARLAMGSQAERYWGKEDAVWPLVEHFFKLEASPDP